MKKIIFLTITLIYSSPKIFSRNFKAEFGMTPTDYQRQAKDTE